MNEIELIESLINSAKKISYDSKEEFDVLQKRTDMIIRKIFGENSHYLEDLNNISYTPMYVIGGSNTDWRSPFEKGLKEFRNVLQIMFEDKKLSSNYDNDSTSDHIKTETGKIPEQKTLKEIKVLIASPSDVKIERELLLDKLETKFRREHYEERCDARIIVDGWETIPSQTGYAQDIINDDLLLKTDIVLAVFRHRLGSKTINPKTGDERSISGTAEELLFAIRNKTLDNPPLGMAYFYSNAPIISLDSIDLDKIQNDWNRLKEFKDGISEEILYKSYNIEDEILDIACKDLCDNIIKYFK